VGICKLKEVFSAFSQLRFLKVTFLLPHLPDVSKMSDPEIANSKPIAKKNLIHIESVPAISSIPCNSEPTVRVAIPEWEHRGDGSVCVP